MSNRNRFWLENLAGVVLDGVQDNPTCVIGMNCIIQTVNHAKSFVDPTTGGHTQTSSLRYRIIANPAHTDLKGILFGGKATETRVPVSSVKRAIKVSYPLFYLYFEWQGLSGKVLSRPRNFLVSECRKNCAHFPV